MSKISSQLYVSWKTWIAMKAKKSDDMQKRNMELTGPCFCHSTILRHL